MLGFFCIERVIFCQILQRWCSGSLMIWIIRSPWFEPRTVQQLFHYRKNMHISSEKTKYSSLAISIHRFSSSLSYNICLFKVIILLVTKIVLLRLFSGYGFLKRKRNGYKHEEYSHLLHLYKGGSQRSIVEVSLEKDGHTLLECMHGSGGGKGGDTFF